MSAVRSIVLIPLLSSACGTVGKVNGGPRPWGGGGASPGEGEGRGTGMRGREGGLTRRSCW